MSDVRRGKKGRHIDIYVNVEFSIMSEKRVSSVLVIGQRYPDLIKSHSVQNL